MSIVSTLSWLLYWTALGLCLGSFLNVVIYRIPRNKSLRNPIWSACPHCDSRIHWYDNIPVISFVILAGRCRRCGVPIATRYVVIEIMMALIVLMIMDAFFIGHVREGLCTNRFGLTDQLSYDWPILLAHIILFGCLLAMSAIDLEHYWVDIRFTNIVTLCGFVLHTIWTPRHADRWIRPFDSTAVVSIMAIFGLALLWLYFACQPHVDPEDFDEPQEEPEPEESDEIQAAAAQPNLLAPSRAIGWIMGIVLVGIWILLFIDESGTIELRHTGRGLLPVTVFFLLIVSQSLISRPSDQAIAEAIYEERHESRRMVMTEFFYLLPALIFGIVGFFIMRGDSEITNRINAALNIELHLGRGLFREWTPVYGFATAASGYVIAGTIGWTVRILFTLVLGKEAFGSGDIHMMAATGCIAGWPVVVIGFFLTCVLALAGWIACLPFKRTKAVPLGPWLSLSFLIVVIFYESFLTMPLISQTINILSMIFLNNSQPVGLEMVP